MTPQQIEALKLALETSALAKDVLKQVNRLVAENEALKARLADPMREVQRLGQEIEQEPPKYSFKAHWEKDGRIGVVGAVVRPDGGVHLLQDFIDPPQRFWQGLTDEEIDALHTSIKVRLMGTFDTKDIYRAVEQALKEKNT